MNDKTKAMLLAEAANEKMQVLEDFGPRLDAYIQKYFSNAPDQVTLIIETYLAQAALRIAKLEGKRVVEGEDFKAAVWWFHQPQHPDDPCAEAGFRALQFENERRVRAEAKRLTIRHIERVPILSAGFARQLDQMNRGQQFTADER